MIIPDSILRGLSLILIPIVISIITAILYYYKPMYRLVVGIVAVVSGSLGIIFYYGVLLTSLFTQLTGVTILSTVLVIVSVFTLYIGIKSLKNRQAKTTIGKTQ